MIITDSSFGKDKKLIFQKQEYFVDSALGTMFGKQQ